MEEIGFLDDPCSFLEFSSPGGLASLAGLESSSYYPSSSGQPSLKLTKRPLGSGSSKPSTASRTRVNAGSASTRLRDSAVAAFRTLLDKAVRRGDAKHKQELRNRLYQNLEVCCAAPEHGARTCECASLVKLLHLPRGYPVCDPRHVSETFQASFLEGCQPHEEGQSPSAFVDHVNDDPSGPCPLRHLHIEPLQSMRRARERSSGGSGTHRQAGNRKSGREEEQPAAKRSKRNGWEGASGDDSLGQGQPEISGLASAEEGTDVGQHLPLGDLRTVTKERVKVALMDGDQEALFTITLCFQERPTNGKAVFLQFLQATSFSPMDDQQGLPVEHRIAHLLWTCKTSSLRLEVLSNALELHMTPLDGPGLAYIALGVLDAFRTPREANPRRKLRLVDVEGARGNVPEGIFRPWSADFAEGAATGTTNSQGALSDRSLSSLLNESAFTAVSSSVSNSEEMGDSCDSATQWRSTRGQLASFEAAMRLLRGVEHWMLLNPPLTSSWPEDWHRSPPEREESKSRDLKFLAALRHILEKTGGADEERSVEWSALARRLDSLLASLESRAEMPPKDLVLQLEEETMAFQKTLALQAHLDERGAAVGRKRAALEELLGPSGSLGAWMREEPADGPTTGPTTASEASLANSEESADDATSSVGASASKSTVIERRPAAETHGRASPHELEEETKVDECGAADAAVVSTATTVLQMELVRDEARRRLLKDETKWMQAAANRPCLDQVVDSPGTPSSLSRVPHFDQAAFLDFQHVKQTSQATSETWRDVSESPGTAAAAGKPESVKAGSDGRELLFQDMSGFGMARRFYVNTEPVRFTGGVPVGIGLWITGVDNDTLELCVERTNQLPNIFERAGLASRMDGGEWHPGCSERSRYVRFKGWNVDCAEVFYREQQQGKVHVLTGARLDFTKATLGDSAPILSIRGHYSVLEGARLIASQWKPSWQAPSSSMGTPGSCSSGLPTLSSLIGGVSVAETQWSVPTSHGKSESDERECDRERQQKGSKRGRCVKVDSLTRGPDWEPGCWLLTGVALDVSADPKLLQLRARFSLFEFPTEKVELES